MNSFIWQGKDSYLDYGIVINILPNETTPEQDVTDIPIIGRDGTLTIDNNAKKNYNLTMTCSLIDWTKLDSIKAWLTSSGSLIFNWSPQYQYTARLDNRIDISQELANLGEFPLIWKMKPYKMSTSNADITLTSAGTVINPSSQSSKPIIKLFGTGNGTLTINGSVITLTGLSSYATINSDMGDMYKDTNLINNAMSGNFPLLVPGNNTISFTGSITSIVITPNWRYI